MFPLVQGSARSTVPFNALMSSAAPFMTSVSGLIWRFVMYWCLKNCIADPCRSRFDNVDVETPIMLHQSADAVTNLTVYIPGTSVFGFDVCHH